MRKIIIIGPAHPLRGGLASYNERLAQEFQNRGDEVKIYTFSLQYPNFLFPGKTQYSTDPAPANLNIKVAINSVNPLNWISVGNEISKLKPDLVICKFWLPFMGPCFGTILKQIKKNGHTKVVSIIDNIIPHEKRIGDRQLAQYFVNTVDAFIVMSRSVGNDMRQFTKDKPVQYIPHPIYDNYGTLLTREDALAHLSLPDQDRYILFFGFIRDYKGLDLLIKAMNDERIRAMNLKLIIAGEYYGNQQFYEDLIQSEKVADQIILKTSFISNQEVRYYFCAADLVVQPYKSATQSGISQLAYHFEKPMLVTKVGGLPEIVQHGKAGYVVEVDNKAITEAILDFYHKKKEKEFVSEVIKNKKRFSWNNMAEGVLDIVFKTAIANINS